ncbi:MAG: MFS transporter [Acidimicrobiia bacterium]|nr:MFS transporter [Acidimicrobiia bacterium]MBT8217715.1 MFS transporter [Acidimicrobiia bacterium]NNF09792.1 MFS transporter [Acidimicrobiia bacterium]NNL68929.1 MFS transporter [Acidimicrobiia bacterium]
MTARFTRNDRRITTLMVVAGFVQAFAGSLLVVTLAFSRPDLELSQGDASWILAIIRLGSFTAVAYGIWGDRLGRRRPLLAAFLTLLAANLATALTSGVIAFTFFQAVARAASGAVAALAVVYLAEEVSPRIRSFTMGIWGVAGSLAGGLAFLLAPLFELPPNRWRWLFGLSVIGIVFFPLLARFLRESRAFHMPVVTSPVASVLTGDSGRYFWPLALAGMAVGAFSGPAVSFASDYLINDLNWSVLSSSLTIISAGALGATGLLIGGRAADRFGRKPVMVLGMALGAGGGAAFYWQPGPALVAWIVVGSFGSSIFVPAISAMRSELFPTRNRVVAGSLLSAMSVTGAIIGLGFGRLTIDSWGLPTTITVLAVVAAAAIPLILLLPETRGAVLHHEGSRVETSAPDTIQVFAPSD